MSCAEFAPDNRSYYSRVTRECKAVRYDESIMLSPEEEQHFAHNLVLRHRADGTAVVGVKPVVAHDEKFILLQRPFACLRRINRAARIACVGNFLQNPVYVHAVYRLAGSYHCAVTQGDIVFVSLDFAFDGIARNTDDTLVMSLRVRLRFQLCAVSVERNASMARWARRDGCILSLAHSSITCSFGRIDFRIE